MRAPVMCLSPLLPRFDLPRPALPSWLKARMLRAFRVWSVVSGLWTTAALSMVPLAPARALDLGSSADRSDETIAFRERLRDYDNVKRYGAERVADRDRKIFQPDGIRAGNFVFFPTLGTSVVFNDNVFLSNLNRQSDLKAEIKPGLRVISQTPRHAFDLSLGGRIVEHLQHKDLNYADGFVKASAAFHFDHAHTLSIGLHTRLDHTDQLDPFAPNFARDLVPVLQNRASIGFTRDAGRLYGTVSATFESHDFRDTRSQNGTLIDQDPADTRTINGEVRMGYRFSPGFELVGKVRALRQYNRGDDRIDRDAVGIETLVGLSAETSPLLRWKLLGGYGIRDFEQPDLATARSMLVEAEMQWLPTQSITFYATVRRALTDTFELESSGLVETALRTRLDYELWHNVVFSIGGDLKDHQYLGNDRHDRVYAARAGIDWYMNKNWLLNVSLEHMVRDSNRDENDLTRNLISVGAKLKF